MTTWCVGGRAAPPRGGGSLAVCLLASSGSEKKRGTVLLTVAQTTTWCERRAVLSKTFHTLCYFTLCCKRIPTQNFIIFPSLPPPHFFSKTRITPTQTPSPSSITEPYTQKCSSPEFNTRADHFLHNRLCQTRVLGRHSWRTGFLRMYRRHPETTLFMQHMLTPQSVAFVFVVHVFRR